jgi:hypothetical protein
MAQKRKLATKETNPAEALDTLNAQLRRKSNASEVIRRSVEADLERKSKRRRTNQAPGSSAWKR